VVLDTLLFTFVQDLGVFGPLLEVFNISLRSMSAVLLFFRLTRYGSALFSIFAWLQPLSGWLFLGVSSDHLDAFIKI